MNVVTSAMITSIVKSVGEIDAEIEADVEHDQLHQAARVHQDAERRGFAPAEPGRRAGDERCRRTCRAWPRAMITPQSSQSSDARRAARSRSACR